MHLSHSFFNSRLKKGISFAFHNTVAKCVTELPVCSPLTFKIKFPGSFSVYIVKDRLDENIATVSKSSGAITLLWADT